MRNTMLALFLAMFAFASNVHANEASKPVENAPAPAVEAQKPEAAQPSAPASKVEKKRLKKRHGKKHEETKVESKTEAMPVSPKATE